jgi:MoxR-like ATPase
MTADATALDHLTRAVAQVDRVIFGKTEQVKLAFACLLGDGHLLIEDLPGVGKTTLAHALAATLGLSFHRAQFTADMLPSDIIGVSVYRRSEERFEFHPGPIFAELFLADEVNRATPRTQSALLEAMAEHQVTVDGTTHRLPDPFFVIATQNPVDLAGTFPLPDSQLDRFLMRMSLGYPDPAAERQMLTSNDRQDVIRNLPMALGANDIRVLKARARAVLASPALIDYVQALIRASRSAPELSLGLSPRAALALLKAARAVALIDGRDHVGPGDVQRVFPHVAAHRLRPASGETRSVELIAQRLLERVDIP